MDVTQAPSSGQEPPLDPQDPVPEHQARPDGETSPFLDLNDEDLLLAAATAVASAELLLSEQAPTEVKGPAQGASAVTAGGVAEVEDDGAEDAPIG